MKKHVISLIVVLALAAVAQVPASDAGEGPLPTVEGVFGLDRVEQQTAVAFWTPLAPGEALVAFSWFNNDGSVAFPEVKALAADGDRPELLSQATVVGGAAQGGSGSWSRYVFETPLASTEAGLYVILCLPAGSGCTHPGQGGGAGVGYAAGDGQRQCWFTAGDEPWEALAGEYRMAVVCETTADKGGRVLRVGRTAPVADPAESEEVQTVPVRERALRVYPNPFNPQAEVVFNLRMDAEVTAAVFDLRGHLIHVLCREWREAGEQRWTWDGRDLNGRPAPSGAYVARVVTGDAVHTVRMTLIQ